MKKVQVISSNVVAIGYKEKEKDLYIDFKNGSYVYFNVPQEIYDGLLNAESKGKYLHQKIKGRYDYAKLNTIEIL
jgi:hypothetical protein